METETQAAPIDAGTSAPPPVEQPWHTTIFDQNTPGTLIPDWHTKAPKEDQPRYAAYKDAKTPWDIVTQAEKRVADAQTQLRNRAKDSGLPARPEGDAATPEAIKAYREAHGLPVDPTGYGLAKPADLPDVLWNQEEADDAGRFFLEELELPKDKVEKIAQWQQGRAMSAYQAHMQAQEQAQKAEALASQQREQEAREAMVQMWGPNADTKLKSLSRLAEISGMDAADFQPNSPTFIGIRAIAAMDSIRAMVPSSGDPTGRLVGAPQSQAMDRAFFQGLKETDQTFKDLWDQSSPRYAALQRAYADAYAREGAMG